LSRMEGNRVEGMCETLNRIVGKYRGGGKPDISEEESMEKHRRKTRNRSGWKNSE
jgi:hypothetical protein